MENITIYSEAGIFAGWPANHGTYQWDNEILVGFIRGQYCPKSYMHRVTGPLEFVQCRSLDYGYTWEFEETPIYEYFEQHNLKPAPSHYSHNSIMRIRGNYDHGGDRIASVGGFWLSKNKGETWDGPFEFSGLNFPSGYLNTSRTSVLNGYLFMSKAKVHHWGSDEIFIIDYNNFNVISEIPYDGNRMVMPSASFWNGKCYFAARRRGDGKCWIDIFESYDIINWKHFINAGSTGKNNGNPPALINCNDKLVCCYGNRSTKKLYALIIDANKNTTKIPLIEVPNSDFGYPTLFKGNKNNELVCTYYTDNNDDRSSIESIRFNV